MSIQFVSVNIKMVFPVKSQFWNSPAALDGPAVWLPNLVGGESCVRCSSGGSPTGPEKNKFTNKT